MKRVGLALGGGGARGLCFIEFCKAMDALGIRPSVIAGTSIGAVVGAFYAAGFSGKKMEEELESISLLQIPRLMDFRFKSALLKGRRIEAFFRTALGIDRFEDLATPLKVIATDYCSREEVVFDSGALMPAIRASISLPAIFEPVRYQNRVLIDGGSANPLPHDLIRDECDYLIAIDVSGTIEPVHSKVMPGLFDCIMETFQAMQTTIINEKLRQSPVDCYISPRLTNFGILDFFKEKEIRASVVNDVEAFKEKLARDLLSHGRQTKRDKR
jgi:NTE family protein